MVGCRICSKSSSFASDQKMVLPDVFKKNTPQPLKKFQSLPTSSKMEAVVLSKFEEKQNQKLSLSEPLSTLSITPVDKIHSVKSADIAELNSNIPIEEKITVAEEQTTSLPTTPQIDVAEILAKPPIATTTAEEIKAQEAIPALEQRDDNNTPSGINIKKVLKVAGVLAVGALAVAAICYGIAWLDDNEIIDFPNALNPLEYFKALQPLGRIAPYNDFDVRRGKYYLQVLAKFQPASSRLPRSQQTWVRLIDAYGNVCSSAFQPKWDQLRIATLFSVEGKFDVPEAEYHLKNIPNVWAKTIEITQEGYDQAVSYISQTQSNYQFWGFGSGNMNDKTAVDNIIRVSGAQHFIAPSWWGESAWNSMQQNWSWGIGKFVSSPSGLFTQLWGLGTTVTDNAKIELLTKLY